MLASPYMFSQVTVCDTPSLIYAHNDPPPSFEREWEDNKTATLGFFDPCLRETVIQLRSLKDLPAGWDSYGASPVAETSVKIASQLLLDLECKLLRPLGSQINPGNIVPLDDGGIQLEWEGTRGEIEVEIGFDGSLSYLFIESHGNNRRFVEKSQVPMAEVVERIGSILGSRNALSLVA